MYQSKYVHSFLRHVPVVWTSVDQCRRRRIIEQRDGDERDEHSCVTFTTATVSHHNEQTQSVIFEWYPVETYTVYKKWFNDALLVYTLP